MTLIWKTDETVGSALTGSSGDTNRHLTLVYSNSVDAGMNVIVSSQAYQINVSYLHSGNEIIFLVPIFDDQPITVNYQVDDSTTPIVSINAYGSTKRILYDNPDVTQVTSVTTSSVSYGNTNLYFNTTGFSTGDVILIEDVGNELNEIFVISSVVNSTTVVISSSVQYPHLSGVTITKLNYDQFRITRSLDNVTYTTIYTGNLNYADEHNQINYLDDSIGAGDNMYYKIYYYNSSTNTLTLKDTVYMQDNFSYIKSRDFKLETGIAGTDNEQFITEALLSGVEFIKNNGFLIKELDTSAYDTIFTLNLEGMHMTDWNADRVVDKYDITAYEYDPNTQSKTFLGSQIVNIILDKPKVIFKRTVPSSGKTLIIKVPTSNLKYTEMMFTLREINKLWAANYLLMNTKIDAVKDAILSWTAGGTTINKDPTGVKLAIETNQAKINMLMEKMVARTYLKPTKLRTRTSSLNAKSFSNYGPNTFATQGGNVYRW